MATDALLVALSDYARAHGVAVVHRTMDAEQPAEFDGLSITLNPLHDERSLAMYLAHSYGSIVAWCLDLEGVSGLFNELRDAKKTSDADPDRLDRAIDRFRAFEALTSEYAVWVLEQVGFGDAVRDYSIFFRADIEAITIFHRHGRAPVWRTFLADWARDVDRGTRALELFRARAVPASFVPRRIERQEVKQEIDGR